MQMGYVLLNCDLGSEEYILEELKRIPQVKKAYITFGSYDIIAEINAQTQEDFDKAISLRIRSLSRVISTMTLKVVNPEG
ncbi:MAG TPA: Lrp/AsnC ligand binding domain-containing protein [Nitrosopumilaceae archaeon]|nr:Lrp/AsnC ligand binding domain-containing protein [Nitrosopumilaceae archaeon]